MNMQVPQAISGASLWIDFLPKFLALSSTHLSYSWHKEKSITDRICRWKKSFSEVTSLKKKKVCTSRRSDKSCIPTSECEAIWVSNNGGWWVFLAACNEHKLMILCNWLCSIYCGVLLRLSSLDGLRTATTETAEQACSGVFFWCLPSDCWVTAIVVSGLSWPKC